MTIVNDTIYFNGWPLLEISVMTDDQFSGTIVQVYCDRPLFDELPILTERYEHCSITLFVVTDRIPLFDYIVV